MSVSDPSRQPPAWYEAVDAVLDTDLPTTEKLLMLALIVRAGLKPDGTAFPSLKTLARQLSIGEETEDRDEREVRQVRRLLKNLKTRELVEPNERPGMTTVYHIGWETLLHPGHQCPGSDSVSTSDPGHPCPPTPDTDDLPRGTPVSALPGHPCPPNIPLNLSHEPPPQPGAGGGDEWKEIGRQMRAAHVRAWSEAIDGARENDCQPADILPVIDWFHPRRDAWKEPEVALYQRVRNATPDQRPDDPATWMPMKPAYVRQQKETQRQGTDAERKRRDNEERLRDQEKLATERDRLEAEHGVECDGLTDDDFADMKASNSELRMRLKLQKNWRSPRFRISLLRAVEQRKHSAPAEDEGDARGPAAVSPDPKYEQPTHANESAALQSAQSPGRNQ